MWILAVGIGYVIGNFQTAFIIGKVFGAMDIRHHGSGNAGATNVVRVLGWKAGLLTFLGDFLKAVLAVYIVSKFIGHSEGVFGAFGVILGHNWPVILGFKGGKGIASTIGALVSLNYLLGIIFFAILLSILLLSKYVSLGSVISAFTIPFLMYFFIPDDTNAIIIGILFTIVVVYKHKENIKRLLKGQEKKIGQKTIEKY